jgi:hypothetical protein
MADQTPTGKPQFHNQHSRLYSHNVRNQADGSQLRNGKLYEPSQDLFNKMLSPTSHCGLQASS